MQENRVPELVHLPVPDECTSIVRHIAKCSSSTSDDIVQHQHPITLHHDYPVYKDDDEIDDHHHHHHHWLPKCNGCVQFISPPFYTCSQCPKLFLHDSCARLPHVGARLPRGGVRPPSVGVLLTRRGRDSLVCMLTGLDSQDKFSQGISKTTCCNTLTNGFTYSSAADNRDIICSLMPDLITHAAHAKTHVLRSLYVDSLQKEVTACRCCNRFLSDLSYNCTTCRNFSIHATCARLPATVRHTYDPHPLELVTAPPPHMQSQICDACEQGLDITQWYYGCADCEQAFHVDCVPCLDKLSSIKYEIAEVRVPYHECPLTLVRGKMVRGRRCGRCGEGYQKYRLALECFKCYFTIHVSCLGTSSSQLFRRFKFLFGMS